MGPTKWTEVAAILRLQDEVNQRMAEGVPGTRRVVQATHEAIEAFCAGEAEAAVVPAEDSGT